MKILIFTTLFPNKQMPQHGLFVKARINALARKHEIRVVAPVPYFPRWNVSQKWFRFSQVPLEETIDGITVYHPRYFLTPRILRSLYGFFMFISLYRFIRQIDRQFPFDLIDAHFLYPDGVAAVAIARRLNKKIILNARGTDVNWYPKFRIIRQLICYALRKADAVTAVSENLREGIGKLGVACGQVAVIPNGIDTNTFCFRPREEARRLLNFTDNRRTVLAVGHLLEAKGFHLLIQALRYIQGDDIQLVIIGEGEFKNQLQQLIDEGNMREKVKLVGERPQSEVALWYAAADVFCLASLREGRPNVVLEAMACGTPVVSMNNWGLSQFVNDERGLLLDSYDPRGIADALDRTLAKKWDRVRISHFMKGFTWEKTAEEVEHLWERVRRRNDILFFSSDDWDSGLKTSKYHLSTRLARENRVLFINSLSLRTPTISKRDARKILVKLAGYLKGVRKVRENLYIYTPLLIPFQRMGWIRRFNEQFLRLQFKYLLRRYRMPEPVIWTFLPNTLDLIRHLPRGLLVYYSVDDMSAFQGVPSDLIRRQDEELTRMADVTFSVSRELFQKKYAINKNSFYAPHGVDFELFHKACRNGTIEQPADLRGIARPIIGFYGLISSDWVDYGLVEYLAKQRPSWSLVFIGKVDLRPGERLPGAANIHYLPVKPYEELYTYSRFFDVAILPFGINALTLHSHPLKILEYLSAGKPVVSVRIPETEKYDGVIAVASDHGDFLTKIEGCLRNDNAAHQNARIQFAGQNSWDKRFNEIQNIIDNCM